MLKILSMINKNLIAKIVDKINQISPNFEEVEKVFDILTIGNITIAKKRFATTFIQGNLPLSYTDIFDLKNDQHKSWWFQGLFLYKNLDINYCPWCKNSIANISNDIKQQINGVNDVSPIQDKLFSDKEIKKEKLSKMINEENISEEVKDTIKEIISLINDSIENNNENKIIELMKFARTKYDHDKLIINETINETNGALVKVNDINSFIKKIEYFIEVSNLLEASRNCKITIEKKKKKK
jgi:hypothetical protein